MSSKPVEKETYVKSRDAQGRRDLRYPEAPERLRVAVYDNHAHLEIGDGPDGEGLSLTEQLDRAEAVGVIGVVQASGDIESSRWAVESAASDRRLLAAVAIHPNDAPVYADAGRLDEAIAVIDELAAHPRTRAIGETGLDYFRTPPERRAPQHESFEAHIDLAKQHDLAMQIHDRDAHDDVLETLTRVGAPERTVLHCFSGDEQMARTCAEAGYYVSFAGNITFKNAQNLRDALHVTPLERILVETDAPFLTPVPLRGRPNAPYLIPHTLRFMADELAMDVDELAAQVATNTLAVYGSFD